MPFVKLDCGILDSTVWIDRDQREIFITALLMASPLEYTHPVEQFTVDSNEPTGWFAPPGWYGFVEAAGPGIIRRAGVDPDSGIRALEKLGSPDPESRTPDFDGRRLIRIPGGYLVLNYQTYRDRDYTTAQRSRRYRERQRNATVTASPRDITQAEAEAEAKEIPKTKKSPAAPFVAPEGLNLDAWERWLQYRRSIGKALKPPSIPAAAAKFAKLGPLQAEAVDHSVANGWTGIFPPDAPRGPAGRPKATLTWRPPPDKPLLEKIP
jgi:hypothetical protein